jgi:hypothetical protein
VTSLIERKYGASVQPGKTQTYDCRGTRLTLDQVRAHITSGRVKVRAGTGQARKEGE